MGHWGDDCDGEKSVPALLPPGSNSGLRRERPASNDVIHGTTSKTNIYLRSILTS